MCQQIRTNHIIIIILTPHCVMYGYVQYYSERRHESCVMIKYNAHRKIIYYIQHTNKTLWRTRLLRLTKTITIVNWATLVLCLHIFFKTILCACDIILFNLALFKKKLFFKFLSLPFSLFHSSSLFKNRNVNVPPIYFIIRHLLFFPSTCDISSWYIY